jgi:hypothetical protein
MEKLVELPRRRPVVKAADGLRGYAHRVDIAEADAAAADGTHDLVDVDRLRRAVALFHAHGGLGVSLVTRIEGGGR